jgi:hypothetical protein
MFYVHGLGCCPMKCVDFIDLVVVYEMFVSWTWVSSYEMFDSIDLGIVLWKCLIP